MDLEISLKMFMILYADVDECLASPCDQLCNNTDGSFECSCEEGYTVNGRMCEGIVAYIAR